MFARTLRVATQTSVLALGVLALAVPAVVTPALADGELNLYSSRHYDTDERLYSDFEAATGITVNRIEASADELIQRMSSEGANSPADILMTVDAGRLYRADELGLFQAYDSKELEQRVPSYLRHPDGHWYGFSQRARVIFYAKDRVENPPLTYQGLADPQYEGMVCARSSSNIYMLSLLAALIDHMGEDAAQEWAEGFYGNFARAPEGGDTDQLRALVSGECDIVVGNTYYFARAVRTEVSGVSAADQENIGWVFPNQETTGAHVNISGAGIAAHAPNAENAALFLEYLASDQAQEYFSAGNDEYPAVMGTALSPSVASLGLFRQDTLNLTALGENQALAQEIYNRVGYP
ncbi:MAG: Fe(3+) ABC transporter substrate-binding protein [Hyphomicrobiales bacterium]